MDSILAKIEASGGMDDEDAKKLDKFYKNVKMRAEGIDNAAGKQAIIIELYNNFFQSAFPKLSGQMGIVYTPVEVVDFIIHSVNDVLHAEFGRKLTNENVNILDPFTGTGTFITRLIQSGLIDKKDLTRKYQHELFANDIVLLAYYIASVNIENAYHDATDKKKYLPFEGIAYTDTFRAWEDEQNESSNQGQQQLILDQNTNRKRKQNKQPITVIFGNPPYSAGQKSANDDAQNYDYPHLDRAISNSYVALTDARTRNSLYDSFVRAFRYATDRLGNGDGIICYVSNGSWLDSVSATGFRRSIEKEFAKIYVFNLRGNIRKFNKEEGGNIFGSGSMVSIAVTLLVKRAGFKGKAEILYRDIGDHLKTGEKLELVNNTKTFLNPALNLKTLTPNEHSDWITERNELFQTYMPLAAEKKFDVGTESVFITSSGGIKSNRDAWVYNYSWRRG